MSDPEEERILPSSPNLIQVASFGHLSPRSQAVRRSVSAPVSSVPLEASIQLQRSLESIRTQNVLDRDSIQGAFASTSQLSSPELQSSPHSSPQVSPESIKYLRPLAPFNSPPLPSTSIPPLRSRKSLPLPYMSPNRGRWIEELESHHQPAPSSSGDWSSKEITIDAIFGLDLRLTPSRHEEDERGRSIHRSTSPRRESEHRSTSSKNSSKRRGLRSRSRPTLPLPPTAAQAIVIQTRQEDARLLSDSRFLLPRGFDPNRRRQSTPNPFAPGGGGTNPTTSTNLFRSTALAPPPPLLPLPRTGQQQFHQTSPRQRSAPLPVIGFDFPGRVETPEPSQGPLGTIRIPSPRAAADTSSPTSPHLQQLSAAEIVLEKEERERRMNDFFKKESELKRAKGKGKGKEKEKADEQEEREDLRKGGVEIGKGGK